MFSHQQLCFTIDMITQKNIIELFVNNEDNVNTDEQPEVMNTKNHQENLSAKSGYYSTLSRYPINTST